MYLSSVRQILRIKIFTWDRVQIFRHVEGVNGMLLVTNRASRSHGRNAELRSCFLEINPSRFLCIPFFLSLPHFLTSTCLDIYNYGPLYQVHRVELSSYPTYFIDKEGPPHIQLRNNCHFGTNCQEVASSIITFLTVLILWLTGLYPTYTCNFYFLLLSRTPQDMLSD